MGKVSLNVQVSEEVGLALTSETESHGGITDDIVEDALSNHLFWRRHERDILRQRLVEADEGPWISEEAMTAWMDSWFTDNELPTPKPDIFK